MNVKYMGITFSNRTLGSVAAPSQSSPYSSRKFVGLRKKIWGFSFVNPQILQPIQIFAPHTGYLLSATSRSNRTQGTISSCDAHIKGFSLLEVMIAVAILAVSFLTLLNFQGETMFRLGRAEKMTQATFLAREKMAEVLLQVEKEYVQQRVFPDDKSDSGAFEKPYENFQWEWQLRKVEIPVPSGEEGEGGTMMMSMMRMVTTQIKDMVREIKLTVKWEELGKERSLDVVTHLAKL